MLLALLAAAVLPALASAQPTADNVLPFGFRFAEGKPMGQGKGSAIQVIDIDLKQLGAQIGLRRDDVIKKVNGVEITSKSDLLLGLKKISESKDKDYDITIYRPRTGQDIPLKGTIQKSERPKNILYARPSRDR
jgi:S1-C subfamily serine protease